MWKPFLEQKGKFFPRENSYPTEPDLWNENQIKLNSLNQLGRMS